MRKTRVWILCGGKSSERAVSAVSAKFVHDNIDRAAFSPTLIHIGQDGLWRKASAEVLAAKVAQAAAAPRSAGPALDVLKESRRGLRPDVVFPVLHGPFGEDGTLQGLLEMMSVPYVGCGVLASAAGMDKDITKRLSRKAGVPILPYRMARSLEEARHFARALGFPLFVKPARQGSSVGVSQAKTPSDLAPAAREALRYDDKILLEKALPGAREIECAVLGDPVLPKSHALGLKASLCGEVLPKTEFYTYASKYLDPDGAKRYIPAPLSAAQTRRVQELSLAAFRALDGYGMARVDFLMDKSSSKIYLNEINTIPGFTSASMYPALWKASGLPAKALITRLIALALRRGKIRSKLLTEPPQ